MRQKLAGITNYIVPKTPFVLLFIPLIYFGVLFAFAAIYYGDYYDSLWQVSFDFYSLVVGGILSLSSLVSIYIILKSQLRDQIVEFLASQKLEIIFNLDLLTDLQDEGHIIGVTDKKADIAERKLIRSIE